MAGIFTSRSASFMAAEIERETISFEVLFILGLSLLNVDARRSFSSVKLFVASSGFFAATGLFYCTFSSLLLLLMKV